MFRPFLKALVPVLLLGALGPGASTSRAQDWSALEETRPLEKRPRAEDLAPASPLDAYRVLIIGDSWAQYMWDDRSHDDLLDRFGLADHQALSLSLGSDPGPGYAGPEVAVSGSEARQWADTADYPWIANTVDLLTAHPTIDRVILSIGGNDVLAGRSDGGWYKDMDLDVPGSEAALFERIRQDTRAIVDAVLAVRPEVEVILSSYDYPNFNVGFWCFVYACPKREDLSRDPSGDLITDEEINALMVQVESLRRDWAAQWERVAYDNSIGLMHHVYGDGVSGPWTLPRPGIQPTLYEPFPGGNPLRPSPREVFRRPSGLDADPIHLDFEGYQHKIGQQVLAHLLPAWRGETTQTLLAAGGGWCDGVQATAGPLLVGDDGLLPRACIVDLDLSSVPASARMEGAVLWLSRTGGGGANPFAVATPRVDLARGFFGADPQVEAGDGQAAADLEDAAWVVGSAKGDGYTVRVELKPAALDLLEGAGRVQVRLGFPYPDADPSWVAFAGAGGGPPSREDKATFAWVEDTTAPVLDLLYQEGTDAPAAARATARLLAPAPNPFNPRTTLRFVLEAPSPVDLSIHDARGRQVRVLWRGSLPAGRHQEVWDGRDGAGRAVASGVYRAVLQVEDGRWSRPLVLVR